MWLLFERIILLDAALTIILYLTLLFPLGSVFSKSEYVIFKLKEMGKIQEKDVLQICDQFSKLDPSDCGKITLPHLLGGTL